MLLVLAALLPATDAVAQTTTTADGGPDPSAIRIRTGPLAMTPKVELTNLGVDTNVFNEPNDANPKEDFTFTVTPSIDIWLRMGRSWLQTTIREDLVWYQTYDSERSANTSYSMNWKTYLNRFRLVVTPDYLNTRERPGYEIDARSQRVEYGVKGDVEVRTFAKTFLAVNGSWRKVDFDQDAFYVGTSLAFQLNRTMTGAGVSIRHQLTPLTTISMNVGRTQDRFEFVPLRDSDSTTISASVSLDPQALIKGTASIGYRNFQPVVRSVPNYEGATALGSLSYTLLGMTRFSGEFKRDVGYSYDVNQPYYLETGFNASIAQQIFGPFDAIARFGASRLAYRDRAGADVEVADRTDRVRSYGGGVGYHMGRDLRLGFNIDHQRRITEVTGREYEGLRYGIAVTYGY
jgi:putative beta-barrel porin BBP2